MGAPAGPAISPPGQLLGRLREEEQVAGDWQGPPRAASELVDRVAASPRSEVGKGGCSVASRQECVPGGGRGAKMEGGSGPALCLGPSA